MAELVPVRSVLASCSDKTGLADLCSALAAKGAKIIASSSTAAHLRDAGLTVVDVAEVTGAPEMLDGRVKTLHPNIHGAILANRDLPDHMTQLSDRGIEPIDLVICNLYPFREAVARGASDPETIEEIDIGGPTLVRAAAKNHGGVATLTDPARYGDVLEEVQRTGGTSLALRRSLAADAFRLIATYDIAIASWFDRDEDLPREMSVSLERAGAPLRYGENPHQRGALYVSRDAHAGTLARARIIQGKELSFNNWYDLDAALAAVMEFADPACVIVKHAIPCGVAVAEDISGAYERALDADRLSAFGGVVAFNGIMTADAARASLDIHTECIVALGYEPEALELLATKKGRRVLELNGIPTAERSMRKISGGFLVQDADAGDDPREEMTVATKVAPTDEQWRDLLFGWKVVKHVRSNAIVLARDGVTVGVGAGQVSRVDAADIAARKAGDRAKGSVMASDAFFPFRDGLDAGAAAGALAVIQPGGGSREAEVIAAADEHQIAMVFTGRRHFRHG